MDFCQKLFSWLLNWILRLQKNISKKKHIFLKVYFNFIKVFWASAKSKKFWQGCKNFILWVQSNILRTVLKKNPSVSDFEPKFFGRLSLTLKTVDEKISTRLSKLRSTCPNTFRGKKEVYEKLFLIGNLFWSFRENFSDFWRKTFRRD